MQSWGDRLGVTWVYNFGIPILFDNYGICMYLYVYQVHIYVYICILKVYLTMVYCIPEISQSGGSYGFETI